MEESRNAAVQSGTVVENGAKETAKVNISGKSGVNEAEEKTRKPEGSAEKAKEEAAEKVNPLEAEIKRLKEENARQKSQFEAAIRQYSVERAAEDFLRSEGAKNPRLLLKLIDLSAAELDDKGMAKGLEEQLEALKRDEPYLFDEKNVTRNSCFRPEEASDFSETSKPDLSQMTYSQMLKMM